MMVILILAELAVSVVTLAVLVWAVRRGGAGCKCRNLPQPSAAPSRREPLSWEPGADGGGAAVSGVWAGAETGPYGIESGAEEDRKAEKEQRELREGILSILAYDGGEKK